MPVPRTIRGLSCSPPMHHTAPIKHHNAEKMPSMTAFMVWGGDLGGFQDRPRPEHSLLRGCWAISSQSRTSGTGHDWFLYSSTFIHRISGYYGARRRCPSACIKSHSMSSLCSVFATCTAAQCQWTRPHQKQHEILVINRSNIYYLKQ